MDYENVIPLRRVRATPLPNALVIWRHVRIDGSDELEGGFSYYDLECIAIIGITE